MRHWIMILGLMASAYWPQVALAAPTETWLGLPNSREVMIDEPVFQGQAYVYEAGMDHDRTVVLVHGLGDNAARDWAGLIPELAAHYHVVTFDLPGFGRSTKANRLYSPEAYTAFLKYVADKYARRPFALIGHSMGGALALRYAGVHAQDVERLILVDVAGILHKQAYSKFLTYLGIDMLPRFYRDQPAHLSNLAGKLMEKMEKFSFAGEFVLNTEAGREKFLSGDPNRIAGYALVEEDFGPWIGRIKAPTLLIWGRDDPVAPLRTGGLLAGMLPHARLEILDKVGHVPMRENPGRFNELVRARLAEGRTALLSRPTATVRSFEGYDSQRVGRCRQQRGQIFEGDYARIEIDGCKEVVIRRARVRAVVIRNAWVSMEDSAIEGGDIGLVAEQTRLEVTGGRIMGDVAIRASGSRLDLAGVTLVGRKAAVTVPDSAGRARDTVPGVSLIFSVSHVQSPLGSSPLHDARQLAPGQSL